MDKPDLLVGSPMCIEFSPWQRLNKVKSANPEGYVERRRKAVRHLEFVCKLYKLQLDAGRLFLHEHPLQADSWGEPCIKGVLKGHGVATISMDQCQFGQCDEYGAPVKKPTTWMSNSKHVLEALEKRCKGRGGWCPQEDGWARHRPCYGAVAKAAAVYPFKLCRAILEGLVKEMKEADRWDERASLVLPQGHCEQDADKTQLMDTFNRAVCSIMQGEKGGMFHDATTGGVLKDSLVQVARALEMEYFVQKKVYTKVPREEAFRRAGKAPISVKWVGTNKGNDEQPNYRSRLVAREIRKKGENPIFAPTPPLEALRTVLMLASTPSLWAEGRVSAAGEERMQVSFIDISRAYFNARTNCDSVVTWGRYIIN